MTLLEDIKNKPIMYLPKEVRENLYKQNNITQIKKDNINELLTNTKIQKEIGYKKHEDGTYTIAINTKTPNITKEMLNWWNNWIGKNNQYYKAWYPQTHINILQTNNTINIINKFKENPIEVALRIKKIDEFQIKKETLKENNINSILIANIGLIRGYIGFAKLIQFLKTDTENEIITRIIIENTIPKRIKNKILTEENLYIISKYLYISNMRLNEILPEIYDNFQEKSFKVKIEELNDNNTL